MAMGLDTFKKIQKNRPKPKGKAKPRKERLLMPFEYASDLQSKAPATAENSAIDKGIDPRSEPATGVTKAASSSPTASIPFSQVAQGNPPTNSENRSNQGTIGEQLGNNGVCTRVPIGEQTGNKTVSNQGTIGEQLGNKNTSNQGTIREQFNYTISTERNTERASKLENSSVNRGTNREQSGNKEVSIQGTIREQLGNNSNHIQGTNVPIEPLPDSSNQGTIREQLGNNKFVDQGSNGPRTTPQTSPNQGTIREQLGNNLSPDQALNHPTDQPQSATNQQTIAEQPTNIQIPSAPIKDPLIKILSGFTHQNIGEQTSKRGEPKFKSAAISSSIVQTAVDPNLTPRENQQGDRDGQNPGSLNPVKIPAEKLNKTIDKDQKGELKAHHSASENTYKKLSNKYNAVPEPKQLGNNQGTYGGTNGEQLGNVTGNKEGTKREQLGNKRGTQWGTNGEQLGNKNDPFGANQTTQITPPENAFARLSGLQKEILFFLYLLSEQNGSRVIGPITKELISFELKTNKELVKTGISRLCKKSCLLRSGGKSGRGGFLILEIPEAIYKQLSMEKMTLRHHRSYSLNMHSIGEQSGNNQGTYGGTQRGTNPPSSSSGINSELKKTTTTKQPLENEWAEIQIPEILKKSRISENVIFQCRNRAIMDAKALQDSLNSFAFDVATNDIINTKNILNPQAWFMSSLTKHGGYAQASNYISDEEKSEIEMLERLETREKEKASRKARIFDLSYSDWSTGLSDEDKRAIKPAVAQNITGPIFEAFLKNYFETEIYRKK